MNLKANSFTKLFQIVGPLTTLSKKKRVDSENYF